MHDEPVDDGARAAARRFAPGGEPSPVRDDELPALEAVYGLVFLLPAVAPPEELAGSLSAPDNTPTAPRDQPTAARRAGRASGAIEHEPRLLRVPITSAAIAVGVLVVLIAVASLALNVVLLRSGTTAPHSPRPLVPAETAPGAYGTAFIDRDRLIILVSGLPEPAASVSYVAWWVAGGRATALGRLNVDDGSGRLTTAAPEGNGAIQITFERNPRATEPDGPVVMFSVPR